MYRSTWGYGGWGGYGGYGGWGYPRGYLAAGIGYPYQGGWGSFYPYYGYGYGGYPLI
jgi:hypothetical protein